MTSTFCSYLLHLTRFAARLSIAAAQVFVIILLAWLILGETLVAVQITGIITVISGVFLVQLAGKRQQPEME